MKREANSTLQKETDDNSPATAQPTKKSKRIKARSYWESPETKALFCPKNDKRVLKTLHSRLKSLREDVATYGGFNSIIQEFYLPDSNSSN